MSQQHTTDIAAFFHGAVEQSGTASVMIDRDLIITYANKATLALLKKHEATFQQKYPGFKADADALIGTCIDDFHKDPAHQRKLLSDPSNLPWITDIQIEHLCFELNVTAINDANGDYIGNSLEWQDVTAARAQENQAVQLQGAIDRSGTAQVMIDRDFIITYANQATLALLKEHEATFQQKYPGFKADALIGTCIDSFHADPAHQRKLLDDPANLPWQTDIQIEHLSFELNVTAINDANGNYIGNSLEWQDVTEMRESQAKNADFAGQMDAIDKALAVISFNMDGTIVFANDNFLNAMGYSLDEIQGKHHSIFVEPGVKESEEYRQFWEKLKRGEYDTAEYKRIGKNGKEVWIQASYNPIMDMNGKPVKVVKYATDVTEEKLRNAEFSGQIEAIGKAQAVIHFNMDGTIIFANDNFLNTMGYRLNEVQGQHHSMFADPGTRESVEYRQFWEKLNRGEHESGEYRRIAKGGREVWIQASYNPIMDLNGKPFKIVKYATDITTQRQALMQIEALVQGAVEGQLQNRLDITGAEGFITSLSEGINKLLDAVVSPINASTQVMKAVAEGDLNQLMPNDFRGEFEVLGNAINASVTNLRDMVGEIRDGSSNVFSAAREIAQGNNDLSQRTESQASNLEQTASAMEQLTTTVRQNADSATEAVRLSNTAMTKASSGGEVVQSAVAAMEEINSSSKKIADIIGVIDEIAFQTNLLALNAAVEAARAGEQGRGFAVVAAEVRNLAQRSAAAAKEIKGLINDSVEAVGKGTGLVDETGQTFTELVTAVEEVVAMMSEIDRASREQAAGINEVSSAVAQMDEMTQQNAALVEEATASSKAMEDQAQGLLEQVDFFKVGDGAHAGAGASRPAAQVQLKAVASQDDDWDRF